MPPQSAKKTPEVTPAEEWISVKHPKLDDPDTFPRVTREAFDASYKDLGWTEIKGTSSTSPAQVEIPAETAALSTPGSN